jgi:hypothetical protein
VVVSAFPFHCAVELEMNPVPVMVSVVPFDPTTTDVGVSEVIAGVGLFAGGGLLPPEELDPPLQPYRMHKKRPAAAHTERFTSILRTSHKKI